MVLSSPRYTVRSRKSTDFPNCISFNGYLIRNFAASLLSRFTKLSNDLLEPLHIPMQSSMNLLKNRIASMGGMFGFACVNKTQFRCFSVELVHKIIEQSQEPLHIPMQYFCILLHSFWKTLIVMASALVRVAQFFLQIFPWIICLILFV